MTSISKPGPDPEAAFGTWHDSLSEGWRDDAGDAGTFAGSLREAFEAGWSKGKMSVPRIGVACFAWRDGRFLMIRRGTGCGIGTWGLPGGRIEFGEHWGLTSLRELDEETGLTGLSLPRWRGITNDPCHCGEHWLTIWLDIPVVSEGEPALTEEATELRWVTWSTLPSPLFEPQFSNFMALKTRDPRPRNDALREEQLLEAMAEEFRRQG